MSSWHGRRFYLQINLLPWMHAGLWLAGAPPLIQNTTKKSQPITAESAHMGSGLQHRRSLTVDDRVGNARAPHLVLRWGGTSVLRAPLSTSTTGELGGDYGASTARRKVPAAVPEATTGTPRVASQTKQNKTNMCLHGSITLSHHVNFTPCHGGAA